jgi:hypothetical protein
LLADGQKRFNGARPPHGMRGKIDTDTLLKVVLVLAVIWLALEVLELFVDALAFILTPLPKIIGLLVIVLIVLYLFDRI